MSTEEEEQGVGEIRVESSNLYREEVFTDLRVATIRQLTPVCPDGTPDERVFDLPDYLSALASWYASDSFRRHTSLDSERGAPLALEPVTDPAIARAIRRHAYLQRVLGPPPPGPLAHVRSGE